MKKVLLFFVTLVSGFGAPGAMAWDGVLSPSIIPAVLAAGMVRHPVHPVQTAVPERARVVGISDGDTLTVLTRHHERIRIRLAEIDAPESRQPFGQRSKQALARLCMGKTATFVRGQQDRYGRLVARVKCAGVDVQVEQVRDGMAWVYDRYASDPGLRALQREARHAKRGLWVQPTPVPPWEFRRGKPLV